jgi:hypothetical protein
MKPQVLLLSLLLCLAGGLRAQAPTECRDPGALNAMARYLAGQAGPGDASPALVLDGDYQAHAAAMRKAWQRAEKERLAPMRAWSGRELAALRQEPALFYPFSGPDTLHVRTLFPRATSYVLVGLEKVGTLPVLAGLDADARGAELRKLRVSLSASLDLSFFITADMKAHLGHRALTGVLPILYAYAARLGDELKSVELLDLDPSGELRPARGEAAAVRLTFTAPGAAAPRTLVYFSWDLSDRSLGKRGAAFLKYLDRQPKRDAYLKAASYLMHGKNFTIVRRAILQGSHALLQDDSGIPHAFLPAGEWAATPFGTYKGPIRKFKQRGQEDLEGLFRATPHQPLPFGIGYKHRGVDSNLVLYISKSH